MIFVTTVYFVCVEDGVIIKAWKCKSVLRTFSQRGRPFDFKDCSSVFTFNEKVFIDPLVVKIKIIAMRKKGMHLKVLGGFPSDAKFSKIDQTQDVSQLFYITAVVEQHSLCHPWNLRKSFETACQRIRRHFYTWNCVQFLPKLNFPVIVDISPDSRKTPLLHNILAIRL